MAAPRIKRAGGRTRRPKITRMDSGVVMHVMGFHVRIFRETASGASCR